ncbi:serine dehydrogenasease [uncultured Bacteroides sp.]|uniref:SDH family Clp fold serine proteinase n=1 Tax=uncultured Bacteroides sp. TaxID=162156 RepID=UPI00280BA874|nr:serine dehydrogenasease [uncultured Bacteroides sp.]
MEPPVNKALKALLNSTLAELESKIDSDVLTYYGPIVDGNENVLLDIVEDLAKDVNKKEQLAIVLTTTGGSAMAVERYVNIIRKHYQKIIFIIPDYAYSAGTIFSMSGDEIWMDYFSVLGPIDPQVKNKEGNFVPALGYLDKVNELIKKAQDNKLTNAEFLILKDFDLAELRAYEQAKELTISLLKKWLVKYKFKNWSTHESNGAPVTLKEKEKRAEEIAAALGDNKKWKSHGRPINIEELEELKLKIEDFSDNDELRNVIRNYYKLLQNYTKTYNFNLFIHTRKFV